MQFLMFFENVLRLFFFPIWFIYEKTGNSRFQLRALCKQVLKNSGILSAYC